LKLVQKITVVPALAGLAFFMPAAQAQEVYLGAGLFGAQIGYAHALTSSVNLRADYMTMGRLEKTSNESGTDYKANIDLNRTALLLDWFPFNGSFRLTVGATSNKVQFNMLANGAGQTVDINGKSYNLNANDSLNVKVKMPSSTPYIGFGFGHQPANKGWGFHSDFGFAVGQFTVTETRTGGLVNGGTYGVTQADMDKEMADIRDGVSKLKAWPQVTMGVSYRF